MAFEFAFSKEKEAPAAVTTYWRPPVAELSLSRIDFAGGAMMAEMSNDARISFNLTGSPRGCIWKNAGRALSHSAPPGSAYLCPPNLDCCADSIGTLTVLSVRVPATLLVKALAERDRTNRELTAIVGGKATELLTLVQRLERQARSGERGDALAWSSIEGEIVDHLITRYMSVSPRSGAVLSNTALDQVTQYVAFRLGSDIHVGDLASVAGQSRFHFQRSFLRKVGLTPHRYVMRMRVKRAAQLIRTSRLSLASVAADAGFADQSHLCRWARQVYGVSPSALRG